MFTLDASVWVNADSPAETGHRESRALVDALAASNSSRVVLPTLLAVEVAGVIGRKRGNPQLARGIAEAILALTFVRWVALDEAEARRALEIAATQRLRGADAIYAAVAAANHCVLVSLDHEQLSRLPPLVRTVTPSEALGLVGQPSPAP